MRTWTNNSRKGKFSIFEFNDDDELVEKTTHSHEIVCKLKKRRNSDADLSLIDNYKFLQHFAKGTKTGQKGCRNEPLDVDACDDAVEDMISGLDVIASCGSSNCKPTIHYHSNYVESGSFFPEANSNVVKALNLGVNSTGSRSFDRELIGINSDDDENSVLSSSCTAASEFAEIEGPLEEKNLEHGFVGCDIGTVVDISPDYIIYGDMYSRDPLLTFSCSCIKFKGSTVCGTKGIFSFEWKVADIDNIESQWCKSVKTAVVNLHIKSKDAKVDGNANINSDIVQFKFAVHDPDWFDRQEAIKSLDSRYNSIWKEVVDIDTVTSKGASLGPNIFSSKHYIANFDEHFEDVIYPKGDPDAVYISKRDLELLQPETFINDTIIDFYIKYLENKISPEEKHRFHFFNSFFFRKMADLDKDPSRACEGRAAFQRVRKWTRKVNLFEKDYIFIPVNFSLHWSLLVICHPGEVAKIEAKEMEKSPKVPCILHMDSIKGSHRGLKNLIQSYLWEEWKERHNELMEDVSTKNLNLQFVPLELPQQENSFDCGLFLLHYTELFLEQVPVNFCPVRINMSSNFLSKDWFLAEEVSHKRAHIRKLLYELVGDNAKKVTMAGCDENSVELSDSAEGDTSVEFLNEIYNSPKACCDSSDDQEANITQLAANLLEGRSLTDADDQHIGQMVPTNRFKNSMSPIEEGEEIREQTASPSTYKAGGSQVAKSTEPSTSSYSAIDLTQIYIDTEECEKRESSRTYIGEIPILLELQNDNDRMPTELLASSPEEERGKYDSSSTSTDDLAACVIQDSEEEDEMHDVNESEKSIANRIRVYVSLIKRLNP